MPKLGRKACQNMGTSFAAFFPIVFSIIILLSYDQFVRFSDIQDGGSKMADPTMAYFDIDDVILFLL